MGVNTKSFDNASDMITFSRASGAYGLTKVGYGSELAPSFDIETNWTAVTGWTWAAGVWSYADTGLDYISTSNTPIVAGKTYVATITFASAPAASNYIFSLFNSSANENYLGSYAEFTGSGTIYTKVFTASSSSVGVRFYGNTGGAAFSVSEISVKEVTYNSSDPSATLKLIYHPNDVPRIEYNVDGSAKGLLVEGARTNSYKYSEDFSNSEWVGSSGTISSINAITSPDGNSTGNLVITGVNAPFSRRQSGLSVDSTISFYAKAQEYSFVFANNDNGAGWVCFDLATESIALGNNGFSGEMTAVGNGWYRCVATFPMINAGNNAHMAIGVRENFGGTYTASSANGTSGAYIWGAQMEAGSFATSYIKTENATATRALDVASIPVADFGLNRSSYSMLLEAISSAPDNAQGTGNNANSIAQLKNTSNTNYSSLGIGSTSSRVNRPSLASRNNAGGIVSAGDVALDNTFDEGLLVKFSASFDVDSGTIAGSVNGSTVFSSTG